MTNTTTWTARPLGRKTRDGRNRSSRLVTHGFGWTASNRRASGELAFAPSSRPVFGTPCIPFNPVFLLAAYGAAGRARDAARGL